MMTHQNDDMYTVLHIQISPGTPSSKAKKKYLSLSLFQKTFVLRAARDMY